MVAPSTVGLTRSPPGVATVAKIAIPRKAIFRDDARRADVAIPTLDRAYRTIGNSMRSPKARNIVVTKSKYGPAASVSPVMYASVKPRRN